MKKRDLTKEKIVLTFIELAKTIGIDNVSFPRVAEALEIKPPSLYNHFNNINDLKIHTAIYLQEQLKQELMSKLIGKTKKDALKSYALVYYEFAKEYTHVYELLNTIKIYDNDQLLAIGKDNILIISTIIETFGLKPIDVLVASRTFRSILHGYISLSQLGYFPQTDISIDDSFDLIIDNFINTIN